MKDKLKKLLNFRIIPIIVSWFGLYKMFMPLLIISKYNHSAQDDFWMSHDAHQVWANTHSVFETIKQGWKSAVYLWQTWDGCLLSMFIGGLPPLVFHEKYYKYTFSIIMGMFLVCSVSFIFVLLVRVFKFDIWHFLMICPLLLIIFTNYMPSTKDAYYWWVGGINYAFFYAVFLLSQALLLEFLVSKRIVFLIFGTIVTFSVGMGNLLSGLLNPIILVLECAYYIWRHKKKGIVFVIPTIAGIAGLLVNVLAPGNIYRGGSGLFDNSPIMAIFGSIKISTQFIGYFYKPGLIALFIVIAVFIIDGFRKSRCNFSFRYPVAFMVLAYLVYCAVFTPVVFAKSAYYGRCQNMSFYTLIIMIIVDIFYVTGWFYKCGNKLSLIAKVKQLKAVDIVKKYNYVFILVCFFAGSIVILCNYKKLPCYDAYSSVESGQAQHFHDNIMKRFEQFYDDSVKDVVIKEINWIPPIFYWDDQCVMELESYFNKDSLTLIPE